MATLTEKQDSEFGLVMPEYESEDWQDAYYRNQHLLNWILYIQNGHSRLIDGSWNGASLVDIVVEFYNPTTKTFNRLTFPDKAVAVSSTFQIWYANQDTGVIEALNLPAYDELIFDDDHFPILYTGQYQSTIPAKTDFAKFIAVKKEPRIEFLESAQPDMVVKPQAQVNYYADSPKFAYYDFTTKTFKRKSGATRTLETGDWTMIAGIETMTAALEFPETYNRPKITTDRHFQIPLGNKGGGVPFDIFVRGAGGICEFITDKTITQLIALQAGMIPTDAELNNQQYVKNRGEGNRIILNGEEIYSGGRPTEFDFPNRIIHPYIIPNFTGFSYHGIAESGVNDEWTLMIDAWKAYGGLVDVGTAPVYNPSTSSLYYKFFVAPEGGYFKRYASHFGGPEGVDPDRHTRESPTGSATLTAGNYVSTGTNELSNITDAYLKAKFKLWSRIMNSNNDIPYYADDPPKTTIIGKIVRNSADNNSVFMFDSETGAPVNVAVSGDLTIDMGGNSGVSKQMDAYQGHWKQITINDGTGKLIVANNGTPDAIRIDMIADGVSTYNEYIAANAIEDAINGYGTPREASQTRPTSIQRFNCLKL